MSAFRRQFVLLLIFLICFISISTKAETMVIDVSRVGVSLSAEASTKNEPVMHEEDDLRKGAEVTVMDYTPVRRKKPIHN
ncbi:hypothetical protein ACHQM5_005658 [Ranunculus cassubicifolius]